MAFDTRLSKIMAMTSLSIYIMIGFSGATNLMATSGFCANSSYFKETSCTASTTFAFTTRS